MIEIILGGILLVLLFILAELKKIRDNSYWILHWLEKIVSEGAFKIKYDTEK